MVDPEGFQIHRRRSVRSQVAIGHRVPFRTRQKATHTLDKVQASAVNRRRTVRRFQSWTVPPEAFGPQTTFLLERRTSLTRKSRPCAREL